MPDPYDWNPPDLPPEQMTDADWLRDMARANFIAEDIERADRLARSLEALPLAVAVLRADLNETAKAVAADVAAELADLKNQVKIIEEAVSMCVGRDNRHDLADYLAQHGVTCLTL